MKLSKLQIFSFIGFLVIWVCIILFEEKRVYDAKKETRILFVSDSSKSVTIYALNEKIESQRLKYEDCLSNNQRLNNDFSKTKVKLRIKDEECEHEKDMLFIDNAFSSDKGSLLSKFGQFNSLSDVERMVLSKQPNREPD